MKKFLFGAILFISALALTLAPAFAQNVSSKPERVVKVSTDTSTNADTVAVTFSGLSGDVKSFQATVTKLSGTAAGGVYLQGTINGSDWVNIGTNDTLVVNATSQTKVWTLSATSYHSYRAWYKTTGTQTSVISFSYLRRPDE